MRIAPLGACGNSIRMWDNYLISVICLEWNPGSKQLKPLLAKLSVNAEICCHAFCFSGSEGMLLKLMVVFLLVELPTGNLY